MIRPYKPVPPEDEVIGKAIVNSAYKIHKNLGPGLLEKVYDACMEFELKKRKFEVKRQVIVPIIYENLEFAEGLRLDLLINEKIIFELKAQETLHPVWKAQLLTQLKLTNNRLGFLINFNVPLIKNGITRMVI